MSMLFLDLYNLNADKHSPASSAQSTKRRVRGMLLSVGVKAPADRSQSDCVHEQVAKWIANVRFTLKRSTEFRGRDSILLFEGFA